MVTKSKRKPAIAIISGVAAILVIAIALFVAHTIQYDRASDQADKFLLKRDFPKAIEQMKEAIRLKPDDRDMQFILGETYLRTGQKADALRVFEQLSRNDDRVGRYAKKEMKRLQERSLVRKPN